VLSGGHTDSLGTLSHHPLLVLPSLAHRAEGWLGVARFDVELKERHVPRFKAVDAKKVAVRELRLREGLGRARGRRPPRTHFGGSCGVVRMVSAAHVKEGLECTRQVGDPAPNTRKQRPRGTSYASSCASS
jgi:hypothetical protein